MFRNNTSFPLHITTRIKELSLVYEKDDKWQHLLKYYQYIIKYIITDNDYNIKDSRGLLLYFTMGMGKTRTAVAVALSAINTNVIIILPKSLQKNFEDTLLYVERELGVRMQNKINYISMDAYNSYAQLDRIKSGLDNSLIIVDEAHNLFKSIINGNTETNAHRIYERIMYAKNSKILFLTGTPVAKDPFELVPCMNMLAGSEILPVYYEQFNSLYIDYKNRDIINRSFLANRLVGLVSYMTMSESSRNMFPVELPTIISKIEMSKLQYRKYLQEREKEEVNKKSASMTKSNKVQAMAIPKQTSMSSYYIRSRSASNYVVSIEDTSITNENSPKLALIAQRVTNASGLVMVYSQFVNSHGLKQLTYYLKEYGFSEFLDSSSESEQLRYTLFTGDVHVKLRDKILSVFNSNKNKHGQIIKAILVSKTGAEGIDLKNVRETHQLEPYWDLSRDNQVKARAIRYGSHLALPESERTVQPYLYISIANQEIWQHLKEKEPKTIDEVFHERAVEKDIINTKFRDLLKDVSIECSYFKTRESCYVCNPSNEKLFTNDPVIDIKMSNPCILYSEEEKDAKKITIEGVEYYYSENPITVYKYDSILDGYVVIENNDLINEIVSQLNQ